jgi:hypothetical protein
MNGHKNGSTGKCYQAYTYARELLGVARKTGNGKENQAEETLRL